MEYNKAPRPDGFRAEFYQKFWQVIKFDMMAMFAQLQEGETPLYKLNFGLVTLLPKKEDEIIIEQYRPICILNISFNFFLLKLVLTAQLSLHIKCSVQHNLHLYLVETS
jgi:hypothetical protein